MGDSIVESLDDYIAQMDDSGSWPTLFASLYQQAMKNQSPCTIAKEGENKTRNRYRDVLPADMTRVELTSEESESNYINANHVKVDEVDRRYILTQGPLPHTAEHFWQMIWEQESKGIAMVNRVIEKGVRKCHQYFPSRDVHTSDGSMTTVTFGSFEITLSDSKDHGGFVINTLAVKNTESDAPVREVLHFHYKKWPDFQLPDTAEDFLDFLWAIRESGVMANDVGSLVVHCSAGIGRSGTLILVDVCLREIELRGDLQGSQIENFLLAMRRQRFGLVQTPEQLRFAYLAIAEGIERVNVPAVTLPVADTISNGNGADENEAVAVPVDSPPAATASNDSSEKPTTESEEVSSSTEAGEERAAQAPAKDGEEEEEEKVAQPPCKRQAEDEPAVGDQPQAKRPAMPGGSSSLNSSGQAESRRPDASRGNSEGRLPGQAEQPAESSQSAAAVAATADSTTSGARRRLGARSPELARKVSDMQESQRRHEAERAAGASSSFFKDYIMWPALAVVVAGSAFVVYRRYLS